MHCDGRTGRQDNPIMFEQWIGRYYRLRSAPTRACETTQTYEHKCFELPRAGLPDLLILFWTVSTRKKKHLRFKSKPEAFCHHTGV